MASGPSEQAMPLVLVVCDTCERVTGRYDSMQRLPYYMYIPQNRNTPRVIQQQQGAADAIEPFSEACGGTPIARCPNCGETDGVRFSDDVPSCLMFLRQQLRALSVISDALSWGFDPVEVLEEVADAASDNDGFDDLGVDIAVHPDLVPPGTDAESYERLVEQLMVATSEAAIHSPSRPPAAPAVVAALPRTRLTAHMVEAFEARGLHAVCPICQEDWELGQSLICRMPCAHWFCVPCIERWLASRNSCPTCRAELVTNDPVYERRKVEQEEARRTAELFSRGSLSQRESLVRGTLTDAVDVSRSTLLPASNQLEDLLAGGAHAGSCCSDDGELLISLRFKYPVSVHSITLRARDDDQHCSPHEVIIYANRQLDWADLSSVEPTQKLALTPEQSSLGAERCILRSARFARISALTVVVKSRGALLLDGFDFFGESLAGTSQVPQYQ